MLQRTYCSTVCATNYDVVLQLKILVKHRCVKLRFPVKLVPNSFPIRRWIWHCCINLYHLIMENVIMIEVVETSILERDFIWRWWLVQASWWSLGRQPHLLLRTTFSKHRMVKLCASFDMVDWQYYFGLMADLRLIDKVQNLSDLELATLICLIAQEHCIIDTEPHALDEVVEELELVRITNINVLA